ncbi:hypothetical protein QQ020_03450 [Fulvivirgaceae bacterium BMA12]|uniref:DUF2441 domain-containing protein n=1 Tax=Agaribacillus aureus TaxID=3051825 RepID=A0ABT8L4A7_9BACT|nr:hypothetical protein [Fulvivirgaceae bacterium BMA12]
MATLYTVSRNVTFEDGAILSLKRSVTADKGNGELVQHQEIDEYLSLNYPEGLSRHGIKYLLEKNKPSDEPIDDDTAMEMLFEMVRMLKFPQKNSRFNSFFGFESLDAALDFKNEYGKSDDPIYKVECQHYFRTDMNWLKLGGSPLRGLMFAQNYWKGVPSESPRWECLIKFPIQIVGLAD